VPTTDELLEEVETKLGEFRAAGDRDAEADALGRQAFVFLNAGRMAEAARSAESSSKIYAELADLKGEAGSRYAEALIRAQIPQQQHRCLPLLRHSASLAQAAGDIVQEMKSRQRIAHTHAGDDDLQSADKEVTSMIERLVDLGIDRGLVDTYRHRASIRLARGRPNDAVADYDRALEAADRVGDPHIRLTTRVERRAAQTYALAGQAEIEPFSELLLDAEGLGDKSLASTVLLQEASEFLRGGKHQPGEEKAQQAEEAALAAGNPVMYVMSAMLIAEAREGLGNRVGVIEVLLTCKATLEHAFGPELSQQVVLVLDSLRGRWGEEELQKAKVGYRKWAAERMEREGPPSS
jgi:tetratricopeptide (TPR) repeat protein